MHRHFRPLTRLMLAGQGLANHSRFHSKATLFGPAGQGQASGPRRLARLRPEFADSYPGITPDQWEPAAELAERIENLLCRQPAREHALPGRVLSSDHFDFVTES
jgi:hypothetical protein